MPRAAVSSGELVVAKLAKVEVEPLALDRPRGFGDELGRVEAAVGTQLHLERARRVLEVVDALDCRHGERERALVGVRRRKSPDEYSLGT
jgi:hypothetical protein